MTTQRLFGLVPVLATGLVLVLTLYLAVKSGGRFDFNSDRLYWEYAGRLIGTTATPDYPEWVQIREGFTPLTVSEAVPTPRLAPYTDFTVEYPPAVLAYFAALRSVFESFAAFGLAHTVLMALAFTLMVALALMALRRATGSALAVGIAAAAAPPMVYLIGSNAVTRFDTLAALLAAGAVLAGQSRRPVLAGGLLGLGAAVKLWPMFLVPFLFASPDRFLLILRAGLAALAVFAACHLLWLPFGTAPADLLGYLGFAADRPLHERSFLAFLSVALTGAEPMRDHAFGAFALVSPGPVFPPGLLAAAFLVLSGAAALGVALSGGTLGEAEGLAYLRLWVVVLLLVCSKVFSPEYVIWLVPLALALGGPFQIPMLALVLLALGGNWASARLAAGGPLLGPDGFPAMALKWGALVLLTLLPPAVALTRGR